MLILCGLWVRYLSIVCGTVPCTIFEIVMSEAASIRPRHGGRQQHLICQEVRVIKTVVLLQPVALFFLASLLVLYNSVSDPTDRQLRLIRVV